MRRTTGLFSLLAITVIGFLQASKILVCFRDIGHVFDASRIDHVDYPTLEYQIEIARRFIEKSGSLWGYDPFYLSGFPLSFLWNSNVFLQCLGQLLPSIPGRNPTR